MTNMFPTRIEVCARRMWAILKKKKLRCVKVDIAAEVMVEVKVEVIVDIAAEIMVEVRVEV